MPEAVRFDAAIIGAGPAGCAAAIDLAKRGWNVALLEMHRIPRDKLCGEFISPEGVSDLASLDTRTSLEAQGPAIISHALLTFPQIKDVQIPFEANGWGLSRFALDAQLFQTARQSGASGLEKTCVRSVTGDLKECFRLSTDSGSLQEKVLEARAVIAATGRWSNFPQRVESIRLHQRFLGLKAHYRGDADLDNAVQLHFFQDGYCGLNRVEDDQINLCALVTEELGRRFSKDWGKLLDLVAHENPSLSRYLPQMTRCSDFLATSPVVFRRREKVVGDVLVVGDAAGFLDPFSGDGISSGLRSGMVAAECLDSFLKGADSPERVKQRYLKDYAAEFGRRFFFSQLIRRSMTVPTIPKIFSPLQSRLPSLGQWLVRQTRGRARHDERL